MSSTNNSLIPFKFEDYAIRVVTYGGQPWFCARDVAMALGYVNPSKAYQDHCKSLKLFSYNEMLELGWSNPNPQGVYFILRPDVFRLVTKSTKPDAERFNAWVFEEVLPSIQDTGRYEIPHVAHTKALTIHQAAADQLEQELRVGNLFAAPLHIVQQEAVKNVRMQTGVDWSHYLKYAPAQLAVNPEDVMLEPTELAARLGFKTAAAANMWIHNQGLQTKTKAGWEPTNAGKKLCAIHSWTKGNKQGYNLRWNVNELQALRDRESQEAV